MSLYPSLEDMKVDHAISAQTQHKGDAEMALDLQSQENAAAGIPPPQIAGPAVSSLYPSLDDYMGLNLHSDEVKKVMSMVPVQHQNQVAVADATHSQITGMIAPISSQNEIGMRRAEVKQGIRMVILCKDGKGKLGLKIKSVSKGIFVAFVSKGSPAAMGGIRFGDQILQIDNETLAGYSTDKVMKILKKSNPQRVEFAIRDRPFERTVTLQKDSSGHVGFIFKEGKITGLVENTSATRNGLLIDHNLCEVNGQCVIGMKDKDIQDVMLNGGQTVTVTVMPTFVFQHIVKSMNLGLLKNQDHSIPDI